MRQTTRVKRLVNGRAVGKSFRVYKIFIKSTGEVPGYNIYYDLLPTAIIDDERATDMLDGEEVTDVTEDYERIPVPVRTKVRKSSACPKTEASTEKGKLKAQIKELRIVYSGLLTSKKEDVNVANIAQRKVLKTTLHKVRANQPKADRIKAHDAISCKAIGKKGKKRIVIYIPTNYKKSVVTD